MSLSSEMICLLSESIVQSIYSLYLSIYGAIAFRPERRFQFSASIGMLFSIFSLRGNVCREDYAYQSTWFRMVSF